MWMNVCKQDSIIIMIVARDSESEDMTKRKQWA